MSQSVPMHTVVRWCGVLFLCSVLLPMNIQSNAIVASMLAVCYSGHVIGLYMYMYSHVSSYIELGHEYRSHYFNVDMARLVTSLAS